MAALSGCDVAVGVVAAPLIIGVDTVADRATVGSSIVQPVAVVDASGKRLAGPTDPSEEPKATFRVSRSTLRCSGTSIGSGLFSVRCSNGWTTTAKTADRGTGAYGAVRRVGRTIRFTFSRGAGLQTSCGANYLGPVGADGPFLINCGDYKDEWADFNKTKKTSVSTGNRSGVVSVVTPDAGPERIDIWIGPPS